MHLYAENTSGKTHKKLKERGTWRLVKDVLFFIITFVLFNFTVLSTCYLSKIAKITTVPRLHTRPIVRISKFPAVEP